ncbi:MAG: arginine--tRNA ligase [Francisellaceae bacterium]
MNTHSSLEAFLTHKFEVAFEALGHDKSHAKVQISVRPELSQFQCNGAMPLAKIRQKAPFLIAEEIVRQVDDSAVFSLLSVVKPGFINITLTDHFLAGWVNDMAVDSRLGCQKVKEARNVVIDFGGPNVAKPMHVGHIRSTLLGDCLQRIYRFCGDRVISDVHLGDWGTQMGMLIEELKRMHPDLVYFEAGFEGEYPKESPVTVHELAEIYPRASNRCKSDPLEMEKARKATAELQAGRAGYRALWRHFVAVSIAELKKDFASLGVQFDLWKGESDVQRFIEPMVGTLKKEGIAVDSDGAVIIDVSKDEKDKTPPLILLKSDGAVMYGTTDLATIVDRVENLDSQHMIYVVDKRQSLHFKQVFEAAKKGALAPNVTFKHVGFGTLNGKDGRPFKTRSGGVMHLSTLIDEAKTRAALRDNTDIQEDMRADVIDKIAMATVKFADLSNVYTSDYIFDLDKFSQYEGKTGPYMLYSAVRIKSILRKLGQFNDSVSILPASNEVERQLQLVVADLPNAIYRTYDRTEPHHLCEFAFKLAQAFNKFYADSPIATEEDSRIKGSRVGLCLITLRQLELVLGLLGIEIPERM